MFTESVGLRKRKGERVKRWLFQKREASNTDEEMTTVV